MVWYNTICNIIFNNIIVVKPPHHLQAQRLQLQPPAWLAESPEVVSQVRRQTWCRVNALKVLYGLPRLLWPRKSLGFDDGKFHSMPMSETESCAVHSRQFLNASLTLKIYFPGGGGGCRGSWGSRPDSLVVTVWDCVCLVFPLCYISRPDVCRSKQTSSTTRNIDINNQTYFGCHTKEKFEIFPVSQPYLH